MFRYSVENHEHCFSRRTRLMFKREASISGKFYNVNTVAQYCKQVMQEQFIRMKEFSVQNKNGATPAPSRPIFSITGGTPMEK